MKGKRVKAVRDLRLILGDQLDRSSALLEGTDPARDVFWMAEVREESTHVRAHKVRIAYFLAAMRHYRQWLESQSFRVSYRELEDSDNAGSLAGELAAAIRALHPERVLVVEPGDFRVKQALEATVHDAGLDLVVLSDRHFLCSTTDFQEYARGRKQFRMEFFYRWMRQNTGVLMDGDNPIGGAWNFDAENRQSFGKNGPERIPVPRRFRPDEITRGVLAMVERCFPDHPGNLEHFDWPITPEEAELALGDFITHRLAQFGPYQDAMWTDEPFLYHSRLSAALNLKLLDPRRVLASAEAAYRNGQASLASVEGFIRQILGWREYVRGIYWHFMPEYADRNHLNARRSLPVFYWTGETEMHCLRQAITQTLEYGYAHHIQRLMVTGLYALLLGVHPKEVHEWYLAVYVDAVEWVEMPNTLGMSQFADGEIMASKPYVASGKYIQRMSNYCTGCRYDPGKSTGPNACPFTTLYWDFLLEHADRLQSNQRMRMQLRNLDRLDASTRKAIRLQARQHRDAHAPE